MKKYFLAFTALTLLFACGGSEETNSEEHTSNETDTTAVDSSLVEDEGPAIEFFEDYATFKTKDAIYEQFGEENLEDDTAWYAEGTVMLMSTILNDPETGNRIKYVFEEENPEKVNFIEAFNIKWSPDFENQGTQKVKSSEGLYTGMPLTELIEWNEGKHFEFSGIGWDYAGGVFGTNGTKLEKSAVRLTLYMEDSGYENYLHLLGDVSFNTDAKEVEGAPIVIGTMTLSVD